MYSKRQNKVSRLIQKELAQLFQSDRLITNKVLITVTTVRISPDLALAKVYLSIFPLQQEGKSSPEIKEGIFKEIKGHSKQFRKKLGNQMKNQLRVIPDLEFFIDDSLDYEDNIDNLLNKE